MSGDLRFGPLDDELGEIGVVVVDQRLFLSDLRRECRDEAFLFELGWRSVRRCRRSPRLHAHAPAGIARSAVPQLGEVDCAVTIILRDATRRSLSRSRRPGHRTRPSTNTAPPRTAGTDSAPAGNDMCPLASLPSSARVRAAPPPQVSVVVASPISFRARARNDGLMFLVRLPSAGRIASQPAAITSTRAVLPEPRAPMIATKPGIERDFRASLPSPHHPSTLTCEMTCDGIADRGGCSPTYARPSGSMHALA